jgi:uncharacterized protein
MSDLTDAEFDELDELLARTPEPYRPLDAVMLDGYLCGVLVQPRPIEPDEWLPPVFDLDGAAFPASADAAWRARCEALITRRHEALREALLEDGWFDPLLPEIDADAPPEVPPELRGLGPISLALMPWVAGFEHAAVRFPELTALPDDDVQAALARLYRHLPAPSDEEREVVALMDREQPLATLDEAIEDLVNAVADLAELTHERRWHVQTVKRGAPKVGRNDPCPCGSGRKFKQCHGAN